MKVVNAYMYLIAISLFICSAGCSSFHQPPAYHCESSYLNQSDNVTSTTRIYAEKGQIIEYQYRASIKKGRLAIWISRADDPTVRINYTVMNKDENSTLRCIADRSGYFTINYNTEEYDGSHEISVRILK